MSKIYYMSSELITHQYLGEFSTFLNHNESRQYRQNSKRLNLSDKEVNEFSITENGWNVDIFIHRKCLVSVMDKSVDRNSIGNLSLTDNISQREISTQIENLINDNKLFNYYYIYHHNDLNNLQYYINEHSFVEYNDEYLTIAVRCNQYWNCNIFLVYDKNLNYKSYVVSYYSNRLSSNYKLLNFQGFSLENYVITPINFDDRGNNYNYYYYHYYQVDIKSVHLVNKNDNHKEYVISKPRNFQKKTNSYFDTTEQISNETNFSEYVYYEIFNEGQPNKSYDVYNETLRKKEMTLNGIKSVQFSNDYRYSVNRKIITQDMKLGHITGTISVQECFGENDEPIKTKFKVRVERNDRTFIGEYDVVNGFYEIPQLDVNSRYNIFLIDEYGNMEWQVLSNRQPRPLQRENNSSEETPMVSHKVIWSNNINGYFVRVDKKYSYQDKVFYRNTDVSSSHTMVGKHSLIKNGFFINSVEMNIDGRKIKSSELSVDGLTPTELRII